VNLDQKLFFTSPLKALATPKLDFQKSTNIAWLRPGAYPEG